MSDKPVINPEGKEDATAARVEHNVPTQSDISRILLFSEWLSGNFILEHFLLVFGEKAKWQKCCSSKLIRCSHTYSYTLTCERKGR